MWMQASGASARSRPSARNVSPASPLALELVQVQTDGRRLHAEQHVQLGEPFGVMEELRVRLRPRTTTRDRLAPHERIRGTSRPVVERSGSLIAIGTATTDKTEVGQAFGAVAKRSCGCVGEEPFELGLRQHALLSEQREQAPIGIGHRRERVAPAQPAGVPAATAHVELDQD
jgi:hypothetical protein